MATEAVGETLTNKWTQLQQQREAGKQGSTATQIFTPKDIEKIDLDAVVIRPASPSWEKLERELQDVTIIHKPLIWITIKNLFEQGYGAELLTAAEIARERHNRVKNPSHYFISSISKASENWGRTLETVHETWNARGNTLAVMKKLALKATSFKAVLKLAWRLRDRIMSFLDIATEQGTGIKNPAGVFFALTRKPKPAAV